MRSFVPLQMINQIYLCYKFKRPYKMSLHFIRLDNKKE